MAAGCLSANTLLRKVSSLDVFNLPLFEHHLVVDTRSPEEFSNGHMATAVSFPSPALACPEEKKEQALLDFVKAYVREYLRPENPSPVLIYGSGRQECVAHANWLAEKLEKLQKDRQSVAVVSSPHDDRNVEDATFNHFEHFCHTIADRAREIWILDDSYQAFHNEYDFLCGDVAFADMFPLPHQINKHVFLGSRAVLLTRDCLRKIKLSHLIVSTRQNIDWKELQDISVLQCDVKHSNSQEMSSCWTACCQFITEALRSNENPRIMVILHGRSRSASVVMAYLSKTLRMHFEEAWDYICSKCCHLIDRSLVYEEQLKVWERTETPSIAE